MLAVADAVATRFGTVATPTDETVALVGATARTPNNLPGTPFVVVELPEGSEITVASSRRDAIHDFDVYFLLDRASGDIPRDKVRLLRWLPGLLDATYGAMKLALATVKKSYVLEYEYGTYNYGGVEYHSWHLVVRVWTEDTVTLTP